MCVGGREILGNEDAGWRSSRYSQPTVATSKPRGGQEAFVVYHLQPRVLQWCVLHGDGSFTLSHTHTHSLSLSCSLSFTLCLRSELHSARAVSRMVTTMMFRAVAVARALTVVHGVASKRQ